VPVQPNDTEESKCHVLCILMAQKTFVANICFKNNINHAKE